MFRMFKKKKKRKEKKEKEKLKKDMRSIMWKRISLTSFRKKRENSVKW